MNERLSSEVQREFFRNEETVYIEAANERIKDVIEIELVARHSSKIFHDPAHTLPREGREDLTSVVGGIRTLATLLKTSFSRSLPQEEIVRLTIEGMEAGALAHDVVIELNGVGENGAVVRRRGWEEGGNERESFHYLRRRFLEQYVGVEDEFSPEEEELIHALFMDEHGPEYNPEYKRYIEAAERTIAGTEPDNFQFAYSIDEEVYLSNYPDTVKELLRSPHWSVEDPQYSCMMIDSTKTALALESLLGSTADLGAVSNPDVFVKTGNAEFWELQYGISRDCARFLDNPDTVEPSRVVAMVVAMRNWRKTQVGVAIGQQIRLAEHYTPENISALFQVTFGVMPDPEEVEDFIDQVKQHLQGTTQSVLECARIHAEFSQRFGALIDRTDTPLTESERILFEEAIEYMNGSEGLLKGYVAHVDEELKKQAT